EATQYRNLFFTGDAGDLDIKTLAYGTYLVHTEGSGFAASTETVEIRSAIPVEHVAKLSLTPVVTSVKVNESVPLIDPNRPASVMQIGSQQIQTRVSSLPGRSV